MLIDKKGLKKTTSMLQRLRWVQEVYWLYL